MLSKLKVPHTLVLLYAMIVLAYGLTLLLPAGQFEARYRPTGHESLEIVGHNREPRRDAQIH